MTFKSDIEIAQESKPLHIREIGKKLGLSEDDLELYGNYKAKIDALTDVLLSDAVSSYVKTKYLGAITCDASSQIDLRSTIK